MEIMERLPNRAWKSIIAYASKLKVNRFVRKKNTKDAEAFYFSVEDRRFMEEHNIDLAMHKRGTIFWTDSETFLPVQEEDIIEIDEIMPDEEDDSQAANKDVASPSTITEKRNSQARAATDFER
jgi:hypothetical protein